MSTVSTVIVILVVIIGALEIRRRIRKKLGLLPRSRSTPSSALPGRSSRPRRNSASPISSSVANPILLGLVIMVLIGWLVAAYLLPDDSPQSPPQTVLAPPAPPEEQKTSLSGSLSKNPNSGLKPTTKTNIVTSNNSGAQAVTDPLLTEAALAMTTSGSNLNRVGLMPTQAAKVVKPKPIPPRPKPAPVATPKTKPAPVTVATPRSPTPNKNRTNTATKTTPAGAGALDIKSPAQGSILGGKQEFTVHLGSFADRTNADKYRAKLAGAGEMAFVVETTVSGRIWYRVMSGRFNTRDNAQAHGRDLKRRKLTTDNGGYLIKTTS